MNVATNLSELLQSYLPVTPLLAVDIVGIVLSIRLWRHHPGVSLLTLIASSFFLLQSLVVVFAYDYLLPKLALEQGWSADKTTRAYTTIYVVTHLLSAGATAMLLIAIFGWRHARTLDSTFPWSDRDSR